MGPQVVTSDLMGVRAPCACGLPATHTVATSWGDVPVAVYACSKQGCLERARLAVKQQLDKALEERGADLPGEPTDPPVNVSWWHPTVLRPDVSCHACGAGATRTVQVVLTERPRSVTVQLECCENEGCGRRLELRAIDVVNSLVK